MTAAEVRELAEDIDFAIDVTEPRDVQLRRFRELIEAATKHHAVATDTEPAPEVVAHEALSPPASGGAPDLRGSGPAETYWAALSSSVSPKGE